MIAYLTKSDASEWFNQIIDFLNGSSIKYALSVNPNIYVSCIKQFWTSVAVKKVNDVTRLQALVDNKRVIITEATIRDALRLDDAEGLSEEYGQFNQVLHVSTFPTTYDKSPSRVGKGCSRVETPLFERMIVEQQVGKGADEVHVEDVFTAGVAAEDARISMDLLQNLLDTCTTLTRRVEHLEQDKIAQALEITKLKQRVKKLERRNKASKLWRLQKVGTSQRVETSDDTVMDDVSKHGRIIADIDADKDVTMKDVAAVTKDVQVANIEESPDVQGRQAESQAQIYQIDLEHADKVLSMQDVDIEPAELQEVVEVVTTAKLITEVVTAASTTITAAAPQLTTAAAPTLTTAPNSRALKRLRETQEEKAAKKQKLDEEVVELKRHLQIVPNDEDNVYTEATPLAHKVLVVDYKIYTENNKPYYKIIRADGSPQLFQM
nr:xylulose kinase-1 [Tanacetum cinerariifolium]